MQHALIPKSEAEYDLAEEHTSVWITVQNLSVYIKRNDDNVSVSIYPLGHEDIQGAITETYAGYSEGIVEDEEEGDV